MALSRDCKCVAGSERDSNYSECVDKIFDWFEQGEGARERYDKGKAHLLIHYFGARGTLFIPEKEALRIAAGLKTD